MSKIWTQLVECGSNIHKRKQAVQLLYAEILTFVRRFEFGLPDYYVALSRALVTLEGIALAADCEFDIFQAIFPVCLQFLASSMAHDAQSSAMLARACIGSVARQARDALPCVLRDPHWAVRAAVLAGLGVGLWAQGAMGHAAVAGA